MLSIALFSTVLVVSMMPFDVVMVMTDHGTHDAKHDDHQDDDNGARSGHSGGRDTEIDKLMPIAVTPSCDDVGEDDRWRFPMSMQLLVQYLHLRCCDHKGSCKRRFEIQRDCLEGCR